MSESSRENEPGASSSVIVALIDSVTELRQIQIRAYIWPHHHHVATSGGGAPPRGRLFGIDVGAACR